MRIKFLIRGRKVVFAVRHPVYTVKTLMREIILGDERFLASIIQLSPFKIKRLINEPFKNQKFVNHLRKCEKKMAILEQPGADLYAKKVLIQYAIVRALRPSIVVETGVANGVSSSYILLAMHLNKKGTLHSIDIGDKSFLPPNEETGWIIPKWLRSRWVLHIGDSKEVLPALLRELKNIDVFIHDSLHTYEHMLFEFLTAWPYLNSGGILISDDALWNPAFTEFCHQMNPDVYGIIRGIRIARKPF